MPFFDAFATMLSNQPKSQGLLDFSKELDVSLLDNVVTVFYTGAGQQVREINASLLVNLVDLIK